MPSAGNRCPCCLSPRPEQIGKNRPTDPPQFRGLRRFSSPTQPLPNTLGLTRYKLAFAIRAKTMPREDIARARHAHGTALETIHRRAQTFRRVKVPKKSVAGCCAHAENGQPYWILPEL